MNPQIKDYDIHNIQPTRADVIAKKSFGVRTKVNYKENLSLEVITSIAAQNCPLCYVDE